MSKEYTCPSCKRKEMSIFYSVKNVPVHSCVLLSNEKDALNFPVGDVKLGFCKKCGFISNVIFNPSLIDYSSNYEDQQSFSPTFNAFANDLANHLVNKYDLHDKDILEIGCGKGDFLALLCKLGNNRGVGIDPAFIDDRIESVSPEKITFIKDYYSEKYVKLKADFICCRHTLEHISQTGNFIKIIRDSIGEKLNTIVFFEVPDATKVLRDVVFWDIYHEHCSYFSPGSLARLFRLKNFEVLDLRRAYGDQYLLMEAKPTSKESKKVHDLEEKTTETEKWVNYFSNNCQIKISKWKKRIEQYRTDGLKIVVWGSGSKCVSFLTTLDVRDSIGAVIDINPYRHNKFIPFIGKEIMPPEYIKEYQPDVTLVMNPIYTQEIGKMMENLGVSSMITAVE